MKKNYVRGRMLMWDRPCHELEERGFSHQLVWMQLRSQADIQALGMVVVWDIFSSNPNREKLNVPYIIILETEEHPESPKWKARREGQGFYRNLLYMSFRFLLLLTKATMSHSLT